MEQALRDLMAGRYEGNQYFDPPLLTPDERSALVALVDKPVGEPEALAMSLQLRIYELPLPPGAPYMVLKQRDISQPWHGDRPPRCVAWYDSSQGDFAKWLAYAAVVLRGFGWPDDTYTTGDVALLAVDLGYPEARFEQEHTSQVMRRQPHVPGWIHEARKTERRKDSGVRPALKAG